MKKYRYTTITAFCVTVITLGFLGCNEGQNVTSPISTENYPIATFETTFSGSTVAEGDTIKYTITLDRMSETDFTIEGRITGGTADASDIEILPATIPAFTNQATLSIVFLADDVPEKDETISIEILDEDLATRYNLNPETKFPKLDNLTIKNRNDPNALTIAFGWADPDTDIDIWLNMVDDGSWAAYDGDGDGLILWDNGASSDNPEVMKIPTNDVVGNGGTGKYYVELDPYDVVSNPVKYQLRIGYPDHSAEIFEGEFDIDNTGSFTQDNIDYDYDGATVWQVYRMLEINLTAGGVFTVSDSRP